MRTRTGGFTFAEYTVLQGLALDVLVTNIELGGVSPEAAAEAKTRFQQLATVLTSLDLTALSDSVPPELERAMEEAAEAARPLVPASRLNAAYQAPEARRQQWTPPKNPADVQAAGTASGSAGAQSASWPRPLVVVPNFAPAVSRPLQSPMVWPTYVGIMDDALGGLLDVAAQIDALALAEMDRLVLTFFEVRYREWVALGRPDDETLVALEGASDTIAKMCSGLVASGKVAGEDLHAAYIDPEARAQHRQLALSALACGLLPTGTASAAPVTELAGVIDTTSPSAEEAPRPSTSPSNNIAIAPGGPSGAGTATRPNEPTYTACDLDPTALRPHPAAAGLLERADPAQDVDVRESIAANGILRRVLVCGEHCVSPPNTILGGRFRQACAVELGHGAIPALVVAGLDQADEQRLIAEDALIDGRHRELTPSCRHALEKIVGSALAVRRGRRTAEAKSVDVNQDSAPRARDTRKEAAALTRGSINGLAARAKIFDSPISTPALRSAVDRGAIKPSTAAAAVRAVERDLGGPAATRRLAGAGGGPNDVPIALQEARKKIDQLVAEVNAGTAVTARSAAARSPHETDPGPPWARARVVMKQTDGRCYGSADLAGVTYQFELRGDVLFVGPLEPVVGNRTAADDGPSAAAPVAQEGEEGGHHEPPL